MKVFLTFASNVAGTLVVMCGLSLLAWPVFAQVAPEPFVVLQAAERNRIQAQRVLVQVKFSADEAQCYQVFAVNNCLGRVRNARRDVMADLRRQELVLNSADAKRKAADQLLRAEGKNSVESAQTQAAQLANAQAEQQERQRIFDGKAAQRRSAAAIAPAASAPIGGASGPGLQ